MCSARRRARSVAVALVAAVVAITGITAFAGDPLSPVAGITVRLVIASTVTAGTTVPVSVVASSGTVALRGA